MERLIVNESAPRRPTLRAFLRVERRIRAPSSAPAPTTIRQPKQAEAVLATLARLFPPGVVVCREQVAEVAGVTMTVAGAVRVWARSVDRWPWLDSKGGFGHRRRKGGGT